MNSNQRSIQSAQSQSRLRIFALVALHAFPSTLLVYGAPFFAKALFHWESGQIALVQTLAGVGIMLGAWLGGQITHRTRPRYAMLGGILSCLLSALLGFSAGNEANATGFTVALALFGFGQAIAWPAIETALMEGQPHSKIQNLVGFYNLDWALVSAVAFFIATPLMHSFGLSSLFLLPAALYLLTLLYILFVIPITSPPPIDVLSPTQPATTKAPEARLSAQDRRLFRYLGWLSNPLSYLAINVIVVYNPAIQTRLHLDFATATIWLSLWFYFGVVLTFGFELFRRWTGWRYSHVRLRTLSKMDGLALRLATPLRGLSSDSRQLRRDRFRPKSRGSRSGAGGFRGESGLDLSVVALLFDGWQRGAGGTRGMARSLCGIGLDFRNVDRVSL